LPLPFVPRPCFGRRIQDFRGTQNGRKTAR
jgi:hypothetical protein